MKQLFSFFLVGFIVLPITGLFAKDIPVSDPPLGVYQNRTWNSGLHNLLTKNEDLFFVFSKDKLEGSKRDIYFDKSINGGVSWGSDIRVDPTLTDPSQQNYASVIFDTADCFCVVWSDGRGYSGDTTFNLFFRKTCNAWDSLSNFQPEVRVSDSLSYAWERPTIALDTINCYMYVAWSKRKYYWSWGYKYDIYFYRSTDCGVTWEKGRKISGEWDARDANILVDRRRYIYIFYDVNYSQIFVKRSTDFGVTWSGPIRIDWNDAANAAKVSPSSATDSTGKLFVGWKDHRNLNADIFFSYSTDAGNNWIPSNKINDDVGLADQYNVCIVAKGNCEVFATWFDDRNPNSKPDIYFSKSSDCGEHWDKNILVNDTTSEKDAGQWDVNLTVTDSRELFFAWSDNRNCPRPCDKIDIYFTGTPTVRQTYPQDNDTGYLCQTLIWTCPVADSFQLQVDTSLSFSQPIKDTTLAADSCGLHLPCKNFLTVWWRVRGINHLGFGPWSISRRYIGHYMYGDANNDCKVTIADIVYLVAYLFKGGPPPCAMNSGDPNGDCKVTVADVVYLVAYLFKGGPTPKAGCVQ